MRSTDAPRKLVPLVVFLACACASGRGSPPGTEGGEPAPAPGAAAEREEPEPSLLPPRSAGAAEREAALVATWSRCGTAPLGRQALIVLASSALDPTRGTRDPELAATAAATAIESEPARSWLRPVAEALYLSALELGGDVRPARLPGPPAEADPGCAAVDPPPEAAEPPVALPSLRDTAMAVRIERLRAEVDRLRRLLDAPEEP